MVRHTSDPAGFGPTQMGASPTHRALARAGFRAAAEDAVFPPGSGAKCMKSTRWSLGEWTRVVGVVGLAVVFFHNAWPALMFNLGPGDLIVVGLLAVIFFAPRLGGRK
jgi:hypothetical protein